MFYGEEKRENMEDQALSDAIRKFRHGLSPLFYGGIPYLPFYTATGNLVRFHLLLANGTVSNHMLLAALLIICTRVQPPTPLLLLTDCRLPRGLQSAVGASQGSFSVSCRPSAMSGSSSAVKGSCQTNACYSRC